MEFYFIKWNFMVGIICGMFLLPTNAIPDDCDMFYETYCFQLEVTGFKTFNDARKTCNGKDGQLAVIDNPYTMEFIDDILTEKSFTDDNGKFIHEYWFTSNTSSTKCRVLDLVLFESRPETCDERHAFICQYSVSCSIRSIPSIPYGNSKLIIQDGTAVVDVNCQKGYALSGSNFLTCTSFNKWSEPPKCVAGCSDADVTVEYSYADHSFYESPFSKSSHHEIFPHGGEITITCDKGYYQTGDDTVKCMSNGQWTNNSHCLRACFIRSLVIPNGGFSSDSEILLPGEYVTIECKSGFVPDDDSTVRCKDNAEWSELPVCTPGCFTKDIDVPHAETDFKDKELVAQDKKLSLKCVEGYELIGPAEVKCLSNKKWSTLPICKQLCNVRTLSIPNSNYEKESGYLSVGDIVKIKCNSGHVLDGNDNVYCKENNNWSDVPKCVAGCSVKELDISHGSSSIDSMKYVPVYMNASVYCDDGYIKEGPNKASCGPNGWLEFPKCIVGCTAGDLTIENAIINRKQRVKSGESLEITCKSGYITKGITTVTCLSTGQWEDPPQCYKGCSATEINLENSNFTPNDELIPPGENFLINCTDDYLVEGSDKIICKENGEWTEIPKCVPSCKTEDVVIANSSLDFENAKLLPNATEITVNCIKGFTVIGPITISCNADGTWTTLPTCQEHCDLSSLSIPYSNYEHETGYVLIDTFIKIACDKNHLLYGNETVYCNHGNSWSDKPRCIEGCFISDLNITNGSVDDQNLTFVDIDAQVAVVCDKGFTKQGSLKAVCGTGGWVDYPECIPGCSTKDVDVEYSFFDETEVVEVGDSLVITCNSGFVQLANDSITCLADGTWTNSSKCIQACSVFDVVIRDSDSTFSSEMVPIGETVDIVCKSGYLADGNTTVVCNENGKWSELPKCTQACSVKDAHIPNAQVNFNNATLVSIATNVNVTCEEGSVLVGPENIFCNFDGTWSSLPECRQYCNLTKLSIPNSNYENETKTLFIHSSVTITCKRGHVLDGNDKVFCQQNNTWSEVPKCIAGCSVEELGIKNGESSIQSMKYVPVHTNVSIYCNDGFIKQGPNKASCGIEGWVGIPKCVRGCSAVAIAKEHVVIDKKKTVTVGEKLDVTCQDGYVLTDTVTCLDNGKWSNMAPCVQGCFVDDLIIPNGQLHYENVTAVPKETKILVTCDDNYIRVGPEKIICNLNGTWTQLPHCQEFCQLQSLPVPNSRFEHDKNYVLQYEFVTISCEAGHVLVGDSKLVCTGQNTWSDVSKCIAGCSINELNIYHGSIENANKSYVSVDTEVTINCDEGYTLKGPKTALCGDLGWVDYPQCIRGCSVDDIIAEHTIFYSTTAVQPGQTLSGKCHEGYTQVGSDIVTCLPNGEWTNSSKCVKTCSALDLNIPDSDLMFFPEFVPAGKTAAIVCKAGYLVNGNDTVLCKANGEWSELPQCLRACGLKDAHIPNSKLHHLNIPFVHHTTTISVECDSGYTLIGPDRISCNSNGTWTPLPQCEKYCSLSSLSVQNSNYEKQSGKVITNFYINIKCNIGHVLLGNDKVFCDNDGEWSNIPQCVPGCSVKEINIKHSATARSIQDLEFVPVNTNITIYCDKGYMKRGPDKLYCSKWGWLETPECIAGCSVDDITTQNALLNRNEIVEYGNVIDIVCEEGFDLLGTETVECLLDGTWTEPPACVQGCDPDLIEIDNAIIMSMATELFVPEDSFVIPKCNPGFALLGPDKIHCQSGRHWSEFPECVLGCPMSDLKIDNSHFYEENQTVAPHFSRVEIICDYGYTLLGNKLVECKKNGRWGEQPVCQQKCILSKHTKLSDRYKKEEYYCASGTIDPKLRHCILEKRKVCKPLCKFSDLPIYHADKKFRNVAATFNSEVVTICPPGHVRVGSSSVKCLANGSWSKAGHCINMCKLQEIAVLETNVDVPYVDAPGAKIILEGEGYTVQCSNEYKLFGSTAIQCKENTKWTAMTTCIPVCRVKETFLKRYNFINVSNTTAIPYGKYMYAWCKEGYESFGSLPVVQCNHLGILSAHPPCRPSLIKILPIHYTADFDYFDTFACSLPFTPSCISKSLQTIFH